MRKFTDKFDDGTIGVINQYDKNELIDIKDYIYDPYKLASVGNLIDQMREYEKIGLSPEEVEQLKLSDESKEDCTIEQHNRIKELKSSCDYWEREAKKWCEQLAKVRVVLKSIGLTLEDILEDADNMLNK